jgi:hypothetical protein
MNVTWPDAVIIAVAIFSTASLIIAIVIAKAIRQRPLEQRPVRFDQQPFTGSPTVPQRSTRRER